MQSLESFCTWLAATPVSQAFQTTEWVIPAVQTVHILCVAAVMSSVLLTDLRLAGLGDRSQPFAAVARRYLPFIWWPLPVLLATGTILIVAEPGRALQNPVFVLKMALLVSAAAITLAWQLPLARNASFWDGPDGRRPAARLVALASILVWVAIVFAGRWIAYIQTN